MSLCCAKYEQPEEKVFYCTISYPEEIPLEGTSVKFCEKDLDEIDPLGKFWTKVSHVTYKRDVLQSEKKLLTAQNTQLRNLLQEYCTQSKVVANINMLVTSQSKMVPKTVPKQDGSTIPQIRKTVLEMKAKIPKNRKRRES